MNTLDVDRVNSIAPYKVWKAAKENEFNFLTESGVLYGVGFTEEMEIAGITTYQFSFARLNAKSSNFDGKISKTLITIIAEFFNSHNDILIYICDTTDDREASRSRLFVRWFNETESERFIIRTASTEIEGQGFYTAMIVEKSNPRLQDILDDFDNTAKVLCEK